MGVGTFRNKPCYCNSGKKLKKCCLPIIDEWKITRDKKLEGRLPSEIQKQLQKERDLRKFKL